MYSNCIFMMKKMLYYIAVAAVFMLVAGCSCSSEKEKNRKASTEDWNTEMAADGEDAESQEDESIADDSEQKDDYLTQDLATFDLRGHVASVKYSGDNTMEPVVVEFNDEGRLKSIVKYDSEGNAEKGTIERDEKGRIVSISFESNSPWVTILDYRDDSMLPYSSLDTNNSGNFNSTTYHRDDDGNLLSVEVEEGIHGNMVEQTDETVIQLTETDSHGNWLRCTTTKGDYTTFLKREISYIR